MYTVSTTKEPPNPQSNIPHTDQQTHMQNALDRLNGVSMLTALIKEIAIN